MRIIVIGLGNPILGDDGIGWRIAQDLQQKENISSEVTIECLPVGGISLMEALIGYKRAILIDAMVTKQVPVGSVSHYRLEDLPDPTKGHTGSAHDTSLQQALHAGHALGADLPDDITVVTIEAQQVEEFSAELTPAVEAAIPKAISLIRDLLIESTPVKNPQVGNLTS